MWEAQWLSYNRTFMELKFEKLRREAELRLVIIVPLWNWNIGTYGIEVKGLLSYNRTFMELKWALRRYETHKKDSYNRTFMELKLRTKGDWLDSTESYNRTFMELKSKEMELIESTRML